MGEIAARDGLLRRDAAGGVALDDGTVHDC